METTLKLPDRESKPRIKGITALIDNGYPCQYFEDIVTNFADNIDFIKLGWGTSVVTSTVETKIKIAKSHNINLFMGGTLFEKYVYQNKLNDYLNQLKSLGINWLEVSNGTIDIPNSQKAEYINKLTKDFNVLSEVGFKDSKRSNELPPKKWIEYIKEDFTAGAKYVITEARESGTSGICRPDGEVRFGLINEIADSGIDISKLIFEAPNKGLQHYFIKLFGTNVNLANIAFNDVIPTETLRLGLRGDTLLHFEEAKKSETIF